MNQFTPVESLDWSPFQTGTPIKIRPLHSFEGLIDRIRVAAFAERQAYYAFLEAARIFADEVPAELIVTWKRIAEEEAKHERWLLQRLVELKQDVAEVPVSLGLYNSFSKCTTAKEFAFYISDSEEKGRVAGIKFAEYLKINDPESSRIFSEIAEEEIAHVALAKEFFFTN
jgi:uncharacterized ferritin-like protein (DUF455 family)